MTTSLRDFTILQKLGQGSFGQVFRVRRIQDSQEYALKKVKLATMREKERQNAVNEVRILASLSNEYVIGYKQAFYDDSSQSLCVIMQYAGSGDILKLVETHKKARTHFPESEIWRALGHMMSGLKTLHDNSILHRDLKCANVFKTSQGIYKLGDLNVSKVMKKGLAHTQTGTPYYASPQVWRDQPYDGKSDVWSLGCVVYEMAALKPPFQANDLQGLYRKVQKGVFERIPSIYSQNLQSVIALCLKVRSSIRPTVYQLVSNSILIKNIGEVAEKDQPRAKSKLLQTIRFSGRDLKSLHSKLPKANYDSKNEDSSQRKNSESRERVLSACGPKSIDGRKEVRPPLQTPPQGPPLQPNPSYRALNSPGPRPQVNPMPSRPSSSRDRQKQKKPDPLDDIIKEYENLKQKRQERSKRAQIVRQPSRQALRNRSSSKNNSRVERKPSQRYMPMPSDRAIRRQPSKQVLKEASPGYARPAGLARHDSVKVPRRQNSIESLNRARSRNGSQNQCEVRRNISAIDARADDILNRMKRDYSKREISVSKQPSSNRMLVREESKQNRLERNRVNSAGRRIVNI